MYSEGKDLKKANANIKLDKSVIHFGDFPMSITNINMSQSIMRLNTI